MNTAFRAVAEPQPLFDEFFTNAPFGVALLSAELRCLHFNQYMARAWPFAVGRSLAEILPAQAAHLGQLCREVLQTGLPTSGAGLGELCDESREWSFCILPFHSQHSTLSGVFLVLWAGREQETAWLRFEERLRFEELVAEVSARFAGVTASDLDCAIEGALRQMVEYFGVDRGSLLQLAEDGPGVYVTHSYAVPGALPLPKVRLDALFPWCFAAAAGGEVVSFTRLAELPSEATTDRENFQLLGVKAHLLLPIVGSGASPYALTFASLRDEHSWPSHLIPRARVLGEVIAHSTMAKRAECRLADAFAEVEQLNDHLEEQLGFEQLVAGLSARFVRLPAQVIDEAIGDSLRSIVDYLGVDYISLLQVPEGKRELVLTHVYSAVEEGEGPATPLDRERFPWAWAKGWSGELVRFSTLSELPPEAATDRRNYERLGLKSQLTIPVDVGGALSCAFVVGALRSERRWSEDLVQRLQLLGEVFANALARKCRESQLTEALAEVKQLRDRLEAENSYLREEMNRSAETEIIGESGAIRRVIEQAAQVSQTDSTVLILGETGTGKELLANMIHRLSHRRGRAMVKVNCAGIPPNLVESEFFGHEKGAYTGALSRQIGRFEAADGSTLFLDEVGELPPEVQAKLLRVLQEGQFERLGSAKSIHVNVRLIAATNCDLAQAVRDGRFRADLYYRLNVFPVSVPPLRERTEDIPALVWGFVRHFGQTMGKVIEAIPRADMERLQAHSWPGNIRELRNVVERAMIVCSGHTLRIRMPEVRESGEYLSLSLVELERQHILRTLELTHWRIRGAGGAAELLGLKPTTLEARMAKLGLVRPGSHPG